MPISRFYETKEDAGAAVADLKDIGFSDVSVHVLDNSGPYVGPSLVTKQGVVPARAKAYAEAIRAGKVLVVVDAPLGTAAKVAAVLETKRAGDTSRPVSHYEAIIWDEAAPVSSAFQIPVLLHAGPDAFSKFWNLPVLSKPRSAPWTASFGLPLLSDNATWLSSLFGFKLLSSNATILSSALGLKVLSNSGQ